MNDIQPNITDILNQMILAVLDGRISEIKSELKKEILVENKPFLTIQDVAQLTGLKYSTIYKYCSEGKIGYFRPTSKKLFFTMENIREFILSEKHYVKSNSELKRKVQTDFINTKFTKDN